MNHIIRKYCGIVSTRVDNFQIKSDRPYRANLRCPICGDSQKSKKKARGWILEQKDGNAIYYCHNCNYSKPFAIFLDNIDPSLRKEFDVEYTMDKFVANSNIQVQSPLKMKAPTFVDKSPFEKLAKISQLNHDHFAKRYVVSRRIPNKHHNTLRYAPKFKKFVNEMLPGKFNSLRNDEPRLIIPLCGPKKKLYGFVGRALTKSDLRYITIMLGDYPKVFGLDKVDQSKIHYILEGAIDSMSVNNSIAMLGGSLSWDGWNDKSVFVLDNEPRSVETIKRMEKVIDAGASIVIWPATFTTKDINEFIISSTVKVNDLQISKLLYNNTYKGLEAKMQLAKWRKV